jgi:predicted methyltransferase
MSARKSLWTISALLALGLGNVHARDLEHRALPKYIVAAVADPARPATDTSRDADRKPAKTLAFAGVKPGDHVAELIPAGGYFTRLLSAVVGPAGKVYAVAPPGPPEPPPGEPAPAAAVQAIAADAHYSNVTVSVQRVSRLELPEQVDLIWTSQNYHDFHNVPNIDVLNIDKAVFRALKPGGIYLVLDHAAAAGSGFRDTATLHRIDPDAVKREVIAAGFALDAESDALHNKADPHTAKVFAPEIRGHTDQFILRFKKPQS